LLTDLLTTDVDNHGCRWTGPRSGDPREQAYQNHKLTSTTRQPKPTTPSNQGHHPHTPAAHD